MTKNWKEFGGTEENKEKLNQVLEENGYGEGSSRSWRVNYDIPNKIHPYSQGWKTHITFENYEDFIRGVEILAPEIKRLGIDNKISSPHMFEDTNVGRQSKQSISNNEEQYGKNFVLYLEELTKLQELSDEAKSFLMEPVERNVATDLHIGGRINVRYVGYYQDGVISPEGKVTETVRDTVDTLHNNYVKGEERYKPSFIKNPPTLKEIFEMDRSLSNEFEPHKEDLVGYLVRTGANNQLLKEIVSNSPYEYFKFNDPEINVAKYSDYRIREKDYSFRGKNLKEYAIENGNKEIVDFLSNEINLNGEELTFRGKHEVKNLEDSKEKEIAFLVSRIKTMSDSDAKILEQTSDISNRFIKGMKDIEEANKIRALIKYVKDHTMHAIESGDQSRAFDENDLAYIFEKSGIGKGTIDKAIDVIKERSSELEHDIANGDRYVEYVKTNYENLMDNITVLEMTKFGNIEAVNENEVQKYLDGENKEYVEIKDKVAEQEKEFEKEGYKFENLNLSSNTVNNTVNNTNVVDDFEKPKAPLAPENNVEEEEKYSFDLNKDIKMILDKEIGVKEEIKLYADEFAEAMDLDKETSVIQIVEQLSENEYEEEKLKMAAIGMKEYYEELHNINLDNEIFIDDPENKKEMETENEIERQEPEIEPVRNESPERRYTFEIKEDLENILKTGDAKEIENYSKQIAEKENLNRYESLEKIVSNLEPLINKEYVEEDKLKNIVSQLKSQFKELENEAAERNNDKSYYKDLRSVGKVTVDYIEMSKILMKEKNIDNEIEYSKNESKRIVNEVISQSPDKTPVQVAKQIQDAANKEFYESRLGKKMLNDEMTKEDRILFEVLKETLTLAGKMEFNNTFDLEPKKQNNQGISM